MNILLTGRLEIPPPYGGLARRILNNCKMWLQNHKVCLLYQGKKERIDLMGADRSKLYFVYPFDTLRSIREDKIVGFLKHPLSLAQFMKLLIKYPKISLEILLIFAKLSFKKYSLKIFHYWNYAQKLIDIIQKEEIDIIESHYGFESTLVTEIVAKRFNLPVVVTSYAEAVYWEEKGKTKTEEYSPLFNLTYNKAKKIITPSWHCAKGPLKFVSKDKIVVIYSSIDIHQYDEYFAKGKEIKRELGFQERTKIILFVGQLDYRKGPQFLAKAAKEILREIPNAKIIFVGSDLGLRKELEEIIKDVKKGVIFTGGVDDKLLKKYYVICDVLVFPSVTEKECMGMSIKEAFAAGTPVVAFSIGGISEAVIDGETGYLVAPGNEKVLAEKIIKVLETDEKHKMKDVCIKRAKELFDVEVSARKEMEVLHKCVEENKQIKKTFGTR